MYTIYLSTKPQYQEKQSWVLSFGNDWKCLKSQRSSSENQQLGIAIWVLRPCLHRCVCVGGWGCDDVWVRIETYPVAVLLPKPPKTWLTLISHMLSVVKCPCNQRDDEGLSMHKYSTHRKKKKPITQPVSYLLCVGYLFTYTIHQCSFSSNHEVLFVCSARWIMIVALG